METNINNLKNCFYQVEIGNNNDKDTVINKKLKNILNTDIHKLPLGCKISNTHVKIGNVHLDTFYEAQILFSHAFWVDYFAEWVVKQINEISESNPVIIIGYESYIEPVLFAISQKNQQIKYVIFEEKKYIQNKGQVLSDERIRYIDIIEKDKMIKGKCKIFYLCGISSTLKTFSKMKTLVEDLFIENKNDSDSSEIKTFCKNNSIFLSLIQVLPSNPDDNINKIIKKGNEKKVSSEENHISDVHYLVDVKCEWHIASECLLCFPENPLEERPIIQTSETSVVPIQMIERNKLSSDEHKTHGLSSEKINFFRKEKEEFVFSDYLYYDHIDRMDHHFKYYIRTGHLLKDMFGNPKFRQEKDLFIKYCDEIKKSINISQDKKTIDIIVSPSHFSNEIFPNLINQYVFNGKAHTISFDTNKEFRSNFEIKYSNYSYFIEQTRGGNECEIRFHYVDDQLISGESFYRAKSLISSLMKDFEFYDGKVSSQNNVHIFNDVIVFLSRHSKGSKKDYVDDVNMYFSFIDLAIPSIRNYGDSCPMCKQRWEALSYSKNSTLNTNAINWYQKYEYYKPKSVTEAKEEKEKKKKNENLECQRRPFLRFECENSLWMSCGGCSTRDEYATSILNEISRKVKNGIINVEEIISYIKAMSRPFLYYKENEKKVALWFLLILMEACNNLSKETPTLKVEYEVENKKYSFSISFGDDRKKYDLILVLINCLSEIESNYLLNVERIKKIIKVVDSINAQSTDKRCPIDDQIQFAFKRIVCGIGGADKIVHFEKELKEVLFDENGNIKNDVSDLFISLFFENTNKMSTFDFNEKCAEVPTIEKYGEEKNTQSLSNSILRKLRKLFNSILSPISIHFIYKDGDKDPYSFDGFSFDEKFNLDWMTTENFIAFKICNSKNEKEYRQMYMVIEKKSANISDLDFYLIVRQVISFRQSLMETIYQDIETDAIKIAIQAKKAREIMIVDNQSSHGSNKAINQIISEFDALINLNDFNKNFKQYATLSSLLLTSLINQCVSVSNYVNFLKDNYHTDQEIPFYNRCTELVPKNKRDKDEQIIEADRLFLINYINNLSSIVQTRLKKNASPIKEAEIHFYKRGQDRDHNEEISADQLADNLVCLNYLPNFIAYQSLCHAVDFLCIIQAFINNIIDHANVPKVLINIVLQIVSDSEYSLSIINNYMNSPNSIKNKQLTKRFFMDCLNPLGEADGRFKTAIEMAPVINPSKSQLEEQQFESKVTVIHNNFAKKGDQTT